MQARPPSPGRLWLLWGMVAGDLIRSSSLLTKAGIDAGALPPYIQPEDSRPGLPQDNRHQVGGQTVALCKTILEAGTTLLRASRPAPTGSALWSREVARGCRCRCSRPAAGGTGSMPRQPEEEKSRSWKELWCCQPKTDKQTYMASSSTCGSASHC